VSGSRKLATTLELVPVMLRRVSVDALASGTAAGSPAFTRAISART